MNKKTTSVILIAALSLGALVERAAAQVPVTLTAAAVSQYMFRGVRLGGPCFQPSVEAALGDGALGIWSSLPISDKVAGVSDPEFDVYGSYTFKLNDATTLVPGFTLYIYPDADESAGFYKGTFEPSLALNYTVGPVKLTPKVYYDVILKGPTGELSAAFSVPLADAGTSLDFLATVGTYKWDDAAKDVDPSVKNWGDYWLIGVSMPFQVTKTSKITVGYAYTEGSNNYYKQSGSPRAENTAAVGRGVASLAYAISF